MDQVVKVVCSLKCLNSTTCHLRHSYRRFKNSITSECEVMDLVIIVLKYIQHVENDSSGSLNFIHRLLDSLVVQCWLRVREVPGSIPSQGPPPRQPSGRVLASSAGGPWFNPQSRTASYQRRYKNGTSSSLVQH